MFRFQRSVLKRWIKIVKFVILFSLLISNGIGVPNAKAADIAPLTAPNRLTINSVSHSTPPVFSRPEPRLGERTGNLALGQGQVVTNNAIHLGSDLSSALDRSKNSCALLLRRLALVERNRRRVSRCVLSEYRDAPH